MVESFGKHLAIWPIRKEDLSAAERYLRKFKDQSLTLVDALGLGLMDDQNVRACWSTDRHLALTGRKIPSI